MFCAFGNCFTCSKGNCGAKVVHHMACVNLVHGKMEHVQASLRSPGHVNFSGSVGEVRGVDIGHAAAL